MREKEIGEKKWVPWEDIQWVRADIVIAPNAVTELLINAGYHARKKDVPNAEQN